MATFKEEYSKLNPQQRQAVDTIDGPLLVIAGPGTGKTQLLSARVANILEKTDALPQNILCLTFTESGAKNMRERLSTMIGADAYDVQINTYHAFGSEIINRYPEFFETIRTNRDEDIRFEQPIDELSQLQIVTEIIDTLPFDNPMSNARYHPKDVVQTISELKRWVVDPDSLRKTAQENIELSAAMSPVIQETFGAVGRIPKYDKAAQIFSAINDALKSNSATLAVKAANELEIALEEAAAAESTKPITAWKDAWLHKNENDEWKFTNIFTHQRLEALADVYQNYESHLRSSGKYDFNDMIVAVIKALETKPELRANLQEKYQYLLLDEFQDTNAAQFELVKLIADHPVHEGRPNIMAVGDDDQAIFAFQGADVSNMLKIHETFRDVTIINLTQNYRSHQDILYVAHNIAEQINTRLHEHLTSVDKTLEAVSSNLPDKASIERHEFTARASEYDWLAQNIARQINEGIPPKEIAVLAPKHALLEALVPFLHKYHVPVAYDKRENILDTPIIQGLVLQCRLLKALAEQDMKMANELFPIVLSLDFWAVPTELIWQVNWAHGKYDEVRSWAEIALTYPELKPWVLFFCKVGSSASTTPLEQALDILMGTSEVAIESDNTVLSPLRQWYFSTEAKNNDTTAYYEGISHLSVLRSKLRDSQQNSEGLLLIEDFLSLHDMHRAADLPIINSHPIAQADSAVQLMTTYKAKGLEFEAVYLLSLHDDVWGKKSRSGNNKIALSANLSHVRYRGSDEDELRRLLFVAITRAKHGLYLSSHHQKDSGKLTEPVKYLAEIATDDGTESTLLPEQYRMAKRHDHTTAELQEHIETLWQQRHLKLEAPLRSLLKDRLDAYQMSPTHLNTFIDTIYGGPEAFLLGTLLRFPKAPGESGEYGNAVHSTLEALQRHVKKGNSMKSFDYIEYFTQEMRKRYIAKDKQQHYIDKGTTALKTYVQARHSMLSTIAESEVDFRREGVLIGKAHLSGKIDRLEVDKTNKTIAITDYKTGKTHSKWASDASLHKYRQQLYFYKFLVEGSHSYAGYKVESARLEFVEPNNSGNIVEPLYLTFDRHEEETLKQLIQAIWERIQSLDLPDISSYKQTVAGLKALEKQLIKTWSD